MNSVRYGGNKVVPDPIGYADAAAMKMAHEQKLRASACIPTASAPLTRAEAIAGLADKVGYLARELEDRRHSYDSATGALQSASDEYNVASQQLGNLLIEFSGGVPPTPGDGR